MSPAPLVTGLLLAGLLASYLIFLRGRVHEWPRIARWLAGGGRTRFFALWCVRASILFGGVSIAALALAGRTGAIIAVPPEFAAARALVPPWFGDGADFQLGAIVVGLLIGGVTGGLVDRVRRGRRPWMLGDISRVVPRHRGEIGWGAAMAVVAGIGEELFFRLALPLLITVLTGQAVLGFGIAIALFAGAHRYQGWVGVVATAGVGVLLVCLYLASGALWVAMLVHTAIDLNGLVLRPVMAGVARISSSAATRS